VVLGPVMKRLVLMTAALAACGKSEQKPAEQPPHATALKTKDQLIERANAVTPDETPAPEIIKAADILKTPTCLGFSGDGRGAYLLISDVDRSVPSHVVEVKALGTAAAVNLGVSTDSHEEADIQKATEPLAAKINAFAAKQTLGPCMAWQIKDDKGRARIGGKEVTVSVTDSSLRIAPNKGKRIERERHGGASVSLLGMYSGTDQSSLAIVTETTDSGLSRQDVEWVHASALN
jgi:hypothetical protein